jgi:hypothetical protein
MKYLLFSHGFGVKKDSRGMFTDIASSFPDYKAMMFDYNVVNSSNDEVTVEPYSKQAELLQAQIDRIYSIDSLSEITLIGHSQGCIIPCLIDDLKINSAILLAPPKVVGSNMSRNQSESGSKDGSIRIPRKDGTTTIVTKAFIDELDKTNPPQLYRKLASQMPTTIVVADQDEILKDRDLSELSDVAKVITISGDHNFNGQYRKGLLETLYNILG